MLDLSKLRTCFQATVSSEEVARGKLVPDAYLEAASRLGVAAGRCAAIEDSSNGLRSAAAAGMTVFAVPNREFPPSHDALGLAGRRSARLASRADAGASAWGGYRISASTP